MQRTVAHHKHYSAEHLQKVDKHQLFAEIGKQSADPKLILGKRRDTRHIL